MTVHSVTRRFAGGQQGSIAISFALLLPLLLIAVGTAADYMSMVRIRTELQAVTDAAATASARMFAVSGIEDGQIRKAAEAFAGQRLTRHGTRHILDIGIDRKALSVEVGLEQAWTPVFAHFLMSGVTPVKTRATAVFMGTTNLCMLTLDQAGLTGIHLSLLARVKANNCAVYSNMRSLAGICLDGAARLDAGSVCSAGGILGLLSRITPRPVTDCPVLADPLADREAPAAGSCDANNLKIKDQTRTLSPGTYCGGIDISGTARVTVEPGIYVIRNGPLRVRGSASIEGSNAAFYLTGSDAVLRFSGDAVIRLAGLEAGPLAGLLFFEDRSAPLDRLHIISTRKAERLTGTLYLPRGTILIDPNASVAAESAYTAIIANRVSMTEGPTLVLNSDYDSTPVPVPDGIRSSSRVVLSD